jgi:glycosyltransferase involved in cell wall biosynthesis
VKILLLTSVPPDPRGAGAIPALLHAQVVGLSLDHDVTILTPAGPHADELEAADRLRAEGFTVHAVARHTGGGIERWRRRARLAGAWGRGRLPWRTIWFAERAVQPRLDQLLATERFDVLGIEDNSMAGYHSPGVPRVLTEYEVRRARRVDWRAGRPSEWPDWAFRELDWRRWPRYQRDVWATFDAIQVMAERDRQALVDLAPGLADRLHVNPFGIVVPPAAPPGLAHDDVVAFFGNYSHPPNVDAAVWLAREIMPAVRARVPAARLRLAGAAPPPEVRALASDAVEVVGFVDDVDRFAAEASVIAAPVRIGGGMRMKVLHAMALGRPVVTTSRGVHGLSDLGFDPPVARADDAAGIAQAIAGVLDEPGERARLGTAARAFVETHHSPGAHAARLTRVYAAAIERHGARGGAS